MLMWDFIGNQRGGVVKIFTDSLNIFALAGILNLNPVVGINNQRNFIEIRVISKSRKRKRNEIFAIMILMVNTT